VGRFDTEVDLEEKLDQLRLENQIESEKGDMLEKRILQKQLRKKYGRNWRNIVGNIKDNETLRQFAEAGSGFDLTKRTNQNVGGSGGTNRRRRRDYVEYEDYGSDTPHHGLPATRDENYALPNPGARFRLL